MDPKSKRGAGLVEGRGRLAPGETKYGRKGKTNVIGHFGFGRGCRWSVPATPRVDRLRGQPRSPLPTLSTCVRTSPGPRPAPVWTAMPQPGQASARASAAR